MGLPAGDLREHQQTHRQREKGPPPPTVAAAAAGDLRQQGDDAADADQAAEGARIEPEVGGDLRIQGCEIEEAGVGDELVEASGQQ
jgi:hypothetical protein